jgi:hypothetical protein
MLHGEIIKTQKTFTNWMWPTLRYYIGIRVEILRKLTKGSAWSVTYQNSNLIPKNASQTRAVLALIDPGPFD